MHLVCGEALFDFFAGGSDGPGAIGFDARAGGSPFNVAIGMVRQGAAAGLLTGLSTDMLGARLAALLEAEGVATGYLIRSGRRTTISL
ncbi:MAG: PfkB family carbohydrate kinase, partial [Pseudomonadota bacterium]